jgi:hypothetical protein
MRTLQSDPNPLATLLAGRADGQEKARAGLPLIGQQNESLGFSCFTFPYGRSVILVLVPQSTIIAIA